MKERLSSVRSRLEGRWWSVGALLLIFALVVKTSTVSAPIEASSGPDAGPRIGGPTFAPDPGRVALARAKAAERIRSLEVQLDLEREKSELLQENVIALRSRFDEMSELADTLIERAEGPRPVTAPRPVEALYVREER